MSKPTFTTTASALKGATTQVFAAPQAFYGKNWLKKVSPNLPKGVHAAAAAATTSGGNPSVFSSVVSDDGATKCVICVLPDDVSRHNSPTRADAVRHAMGPVSYTHLTLPTIYSV